MVTKFDSDLDTETHFAVLCTVAHTLNESVMITEADDWRADPRILYVNPAFTRLTGYSSEEVLGQTPKILQGPKTERSVLNQLKRELATSNRWKGRTYNYTQSGKPFLMEWEIVPIHDTAGRLRFHLTVQRQVDENRPGSQWRAGIARRWSTVVS